MTSGLYSVVPLLGIAIYLVVSERFLHIFGTCEQIVSPDHILSQQFSPVNFQLVRHDRQKLFKLRLVGIIAICPAYDLYKYQVVW